MGLFLSSCARDPLVEPLEWNGDKVLNVGVYSIALNRTKDYVVLQDYLEEQLKKEVGKEVSVEFEYIEHEFDEDPLKTAKQRIRDREWDLVFTAISTLSSLSVDNDYEFVARMFPKRPNVVSALFVKKESSISEIYEIDQTTKVNLVESIEPAFFYLPIYDLYGLTMNLTLDKSPRSIPPKVKQELIDVGVAPYEQVKRDPDLKVIHIFRKLPFSGVYISPNVRQKDRERLESILLNAPSELKEAGKYGLGEEIDFEEYNKILKKVDEIVECTNLENNPVKLYCPRVKGIVNGLTQREDDVIFKVQEGGKIYEVTHPENLLVLDKQQYQGKQVEIRAVKLKQTPTPNFLKVEISKQGQMILLE